jgi:hypothetical protein
MVVKGSAIARDELSLPSGDLVNGTGGLGKSHQANQGFLQTRFTSGWSILLPVS